MKSLRLLLLPAVAFLALTVCRGAPGQVFEQALADPVVTFGVELNEASSATRRELERAEAFLKDEQWDEAIETYRRLIEEETDRVIAADYGSDSEQPFGVYIPVRDFCQARLARLAVEAPEALALYRRRVDPIARQWFEEAAAQKDVARLERIVGVMFASSYGDDALYLLAEVELEQGHFAAARGHWERVSPALRTPAARHPLIASRPGRPLWMALEGVDLNARWDELAPVLQSDDGLGEWFAYPDTDLDLADVRARLVLTSILEGSPDRAAVELALLAKMHPDAEGPIGGRSGRYSDLLAPLLAQSREWSAIPPPEDWPTFAGSQERNRKAPEPVDPAGRPLWTYEFDRRFHAEPQTLEPRSFPTVPTMRSDASQAPAAVLSYHPVVVGDMVLFHDGRRIYALRLGTGEAAVPLGVEEGQEGVVYRPQQQAAFAFDSSLNGGSLLGVPRFTLDARRERLTARIGSPITGEAPGMLTSSQQGHLITLDLKSFKRLHEPIVPDGPEWAFEGTPVTDGVRLYVGMRQSEIRAVSYVACFDIETGERLWRRKICSAETFGQGQKREISHNLLTLAEGTLYYNTNLGAVAALSIPDGRVKWVARYPRVTHRRGETERDPRFLRDLNPCLFHKGLVIVFPTDCDRMFALDSLSGQLLWATPEESANDVAHLLGVGDGDHLIVCGEHLYWLNAYSGRFLAQFPQGGGPSGFSDVHSYDRGRGVLAGDYVYWLAPRKEPEDQFRFDKIHVLHQRLRSTESGREVVRVREINLEERLAQLERPIPPAERHGANLIISQDVLLLVTPKHLIAFGP